jgi:YbbR domain-containing protein
VDYRKLLLKIAENWPAKVLSVVFAIVLFVFHRTSTMEERFFSVPLHIETEGNYTASSTYEHTIRISMRGEANSIYPILENDIEAYIDLKGKHKGTYQSPVQIRKKGTALGVDPLEITVDPLEITVSIDYKVSKYVPLVTGTTGSLKAGYELVSATLMPAQVVIDGPSDVISSIAELATDYVDLDGRDDNFFVMVNVLNSEPLVAVRGNGSAEFRGVVQQVITERRFDRAPIAVKGLDIQRFTATLSTGTGSITLSGAQTDLEAYVLPAASLLSVDCSGISEAGVYELPVAVAAVALKVVSSMPLKVTVQISANKNGE